MKPNETVKLLRLNDTAQYLERNAYNAHKDARRHEGTELGAYHEGRAAAYGLSAQLLRQAIAKL